MNIIGMNMLVVNITFPDNSTDLKTKMIMIMGRKPMHRSALE